ACAAGQTARAASGGSVDNRPFADAGGASPSGPAEAWTDERVERLKTLWADGLSASQCAKILGGVSRSAVVGKIFRLGLTGRGAPTQRARQPRPPGAPRPAATGVAGAKRRARPTIVELEDTCCLPADQSADAVPFLERRLDQCAWPLWDEDTPILERMCCGSPQVPDRPFCLRHARLAYAPPNAPLYVYGSKPMRYGRAA